MLDKKVERSLELGYEESDASARNIFVTGFLALVVGAAIFGGLNWLFHGFERREHAREQARSALPSGEAFPPAPRLQLDPRGDLEQLRAENAAVLGSFGWVDRQGGWVRIPVEEAMKLVVTGQGRKGGRK